MQDEEHLAAVFAALASTARLALVRELAAFTGPSASGYGGASITQLASRAELSRFSASRHLGILRDTGLVEGRRDGSRMLHHLNADVLDDIDEWLYPLVAVAPARPHTAEG